MSHESDLNLRISVAPDEAKHVDDWELSDQIVSIGQ